MTRTCLTATPGASPRALLYLTAASLLALIPAAVRMTGEDNLPPLRADVRHLVLAVYVVVWAAYLYLVRSPEVERLSGRLLGLYAALAGVLCLSFPVFSGDLMYYLMRGRILSIYGDSPYRHPPMGYPGDLLRPFDTVPHKTDPYGPLSVYFQSLPPLLFPDSILGMVWGYKALLLALFIASAVCYRKIVLTAGEPKSGRAWALYALSPFVLVYLALDGHNDLALMSLSVIAVFFLLQRRFGLAFFFWTASFAFKYMSILILPFMVIYAWKSLLPQGRYAALLRLIGWALASAAMVAGLFVPVWGGARTFEPLAHAGGWFYNSSIPYMLWKLFSLVGIDLHWKVIKYVFLVPYAGFYLWAIIDYARGDVRDPVRLFRCFAIAYLGFYVSLISPLMTWYGFWAFPWIILCRWPRTTLAVTLYSAVGLLAFYKRPNYLTLIACIVYGGCWLHDFRRSAAARASVRPSP